MVERSTHCTERRGGVWVLSMGGDRVQFLSQLLGAEMKTRKPLSASQIFIFFKIDRCTRIKSTVIWGMLLTLPLLFGCAFPANVKEASQRHLELLDQVDQAALDYQQTFAAVIDATSVRYVDGQAKAAALKRSEELMMKKQAVGTLSKEVQQAMEEAKRKDEVIEGVKQLRSMKERNTKNYEDYRHYLEITKAVHNLLNVYISTDVAPEDKDIEALKGAMKELAQ